VKIRKLGTDSLDTVPYRNPGCPLELEGDLSTSID